MTAQRRKHRTAIVLMIVAPTLWSIAGVVTRHLSPELQTTGRFEITFWRSLFAAMFVGGYLIWRKELAESLKRAGKAGLISGAMWAIMFVNFMLALTLTSTANTLIVLAIAPLVTALLARLVLKTPIAPRTWCAIMVAMTGITAMFIESISLGSPTSLAGMLIALAVPLASAVNIVVLKKQGATIDLVPAVFLGGLFSAAVMLPLAIPMLALPSDIGWLAMLGVFQLGLPCVLLVVAARHLSATEVALLALIEVVLGPLWVWLGAGETPSTITLLGGALVLAALVFNELWSFSRRLSSVS